MTFTKKERKNPLQLKKKKKSLLFLALQTLASPIVLEKQSLVNDEQVSEWEMKYCLLKLVTLLVQL